MVLMIVLALVAVSSFLYFNKSDVNVLVIIVLGEDKGDFQINFGCKEGKDLFLSKGTGVVLVEANTIVNIKNEIKEFVPYDIRRIDLDPDAQIDTLNFIERSEGIKSLVDDLSFDLINADPDCSGSSISFNWQ